MPLVALTSCPFAATISVFLMARFDIEFEWGVQGVESVSPDACIVIVDVLCFTTCVSAGCGRGAVIYPCVWNDARALELGRRVHAVVASHRSPAALRSGAFTLSPPSLMRADAGTRLVLPSPNGSTLAVVAEQRGRRVVAGSLRNASAVVSALEGPVAVIAAGEKWKDGTIRFALEDLLGAGAILSRLGRRRSPEAESAVAAYDAHHGRLEEVLAATLTGRELIEAGYRGDVTFAADIDADDAVPLLVDGAFRST